MNYLALLCGLCLLTHYSHGQDTIYLSNPSFEGRAAHSQVPEGWTYRGFPNESPPDLLPYRASTYFPDYTRNGNPDMRSSAWGFGVSLSPVHGDTYLGMVTRDNRTFEALSQKLAQPLTAGRCYALTLYLASSPNYFSISRQTDAPANYDWPVQLIIHSIEQTGDPRELLAQSPPVDHPQWLPYMLILRPQQTVEHLQITAWYPTDSTTNGNILVDHLSPLSPCACAKKTELPHIDSFDYGVPATAQQARQEVRARAARVRFSPQGAWQDVQIFRYGGRRAVRANPDWFFCRKALAAYPGTIDIAVNTDDKSTWRAVRRGLKEEFRGLPNVKLRRIVHYTPEQASEWPIPPPPNGIAIRFR